MRAQIPKSTGYIQSSYVICNYNFIKFLVFINYVNNYTVIIRLNSIFLFI